MSSSRGFGNGRFARGKRGRVDIPTSAIQKKEGEGQQQKGKQKSEFPPAFYLDVRRVISRVLREETNETVLTFLKDKKDLLSILCDACDSVLSQEPQEREVLLRTQIEKSLQENDSEKLDETTLQTLTDIFTQRLAEVIRHLPITPPLTQMMEQNTIQPTKQRRIGVSSDAVLKSYEPSSDVNSTTSIADRNHAGGILPTPPPLPSVFSESGMCSVHCVTFECLPTMYYAPEAMKRFLEETCSRIPNAYFLNILCLPGEGCAIVSFNSNATAAAVMFAVNSMNISTTSVGGSVGSVSGNSNNSSSGINNQNNNNTNSNNGDNNNNNNNNNNNSNNNNCGVVGGNAGVFRAVAATEEQQQLLWAPLAERVRTLEKEWQNWYAKHSEHPAYKIRHEWRMAKSKGLEVDQELQQLLSNTNNNNNNNNNNNTSDEKDTTTTTTTTTSTGLTEEQLRKKLQLLQTRLACKRTVEQMEEQMRDLYGDAYMYQLENGPTVATYSSSKAVVSNPRKLLFIHRLRSRLDDAEVLQLLRIVGVQPVHIWRDPTVETTLCVELPSVGHVFALLRQLDGTQMQFDNAIFSRDRLGVVNN